MSEPINTGGTAFPTNFNMSTFTHDNQGMTLRDYFAAAACQGILAGGDGSLWPSLARDAYKVADAMLEEREVLREAL